MDLLQVDYQIIGTLTDGNCVCAEVAKLEPDVIVLDISLGERSGIEIAKLLCQQGYTGRIVFLSVHEDPDFVGAAINAGGRGYVFKSRMNTDLGAALTAVLSSRTFISPPIHEQTGWW